MVDRETLVLFARCKSLALLEQQQATMRPLLEALARAGANPVPRELPESAGPSGRASTVVSRVTCSLNQARPGLTVLVL
jgi:hypothetical protein